MTETSLKNKEVKLLNSGLLRLIDWMGSDLSISRNARVSYDAEGRPEDEKLISYLMENGHNTPFESATITFEIKAPIFVFRQWHRHRTQSYNELSARYRELPADFYVPDISQITTQSTDNKQMKTDQVNPMAEEIREAIIESNVNAFTIYRNMLAEGCPREIARSVLPVGTYSHMFATANLQNWYRFLGERLHPHAQYEIRIYAKAILDFLEKLYPLSTKAFKNSIK